MREDSQEGTMTDEKSASGELREPMAVPIETRTKEQIIELYKAAHEDSEYFRQRWIASEAELSSLRSRLASAEQELSRHASIEEKAHLQTLDERDKAEEAMSQAYFLIKGESPQWSNNNFGFDQALEEIDDAQRCLRAEISQQSLRLASAEALIAKWRAEAERSKRVLENDPTNFSAASDAGDYAGCADELESALRAQPAKETPRWHPPWSRNE